MNKKSAGILVYRRVDNQLEVLLVHPGGPYFNKKDLGVWSIPKGEFEDEEPIGAAIREFNEETGLPICGPFTPLQPVKMKSGKTIYAWITEADPELTGFKSNTFSMEWPPKSGRHMDFPEVDKVAWFGTDEARQKINEYQTAFIDQLEILLL
jgi:predicted NUDIX family NTP pyrophosphohydrolase